MRRSSSETQQPEGKGKEHLSSLVLSSGYQLVGNNCIGWFCTRLWSLPLTTKKSFYLHVANCLLA